MISLTELLPETDMREEHEPLYCTCRQVLYTFAKKMLLDLFGGVKNRQWQKLEFLCNIELVMLSLTKNRRFKSNDNWEILP